VFVAASTKCFPEATFEEAVQKLVDLEYSHVEIDLDELGNQIRPSEVHADLETAVRRCRETLRLTPCSLAVDIHAEGSLYYEQFASICKLAKALKVVTLTVRSGELGTPFNAEVERLRELVKIATLDGAVVGLKTEVGHMTQDPATAAVLCDNVRGLGITLDPSHYVCSPLSGVDYDNLFKYTCHLQLRDTSKTKLQVRVGQGEIEYGRLITHLSKFRYNRALSVNIYDDHDPTIDHAAEMRKIRLLLESLL
jgi:sugar phosphate isomerase/epimerase